MKIGQIVDKIPVVKVHKKSDLLVDSETLLGVEVEVENCVKLYGANEKFASYWTHKEDPSLRNNGREFVFAEPLFGHDAINAIEFLCLRAKEHNWKISTLTGEHVHVDVRNMELEEFRNFMTVYALMEPLIYNWVGDNRHENMFCAPWYISEMDLTVVSSIVKKQIPQGSILGYLKNLKKYTGLNLQALYKFGTVEFRMLKTTFDPKRTIDWLNIILSLKKYAQIPGLTAEDICKSARNEGAFSFARKVFGPVLLEKMWYYDFSKDIIGLAGPIADYFLDTAKDLFIKNKGDLFEWSRIHKLSDTKEDEDELGNHAGHSLWRSRRVAVPKKARRASARDDTSKPLRKSVRDGDILYTYSRAVSMDFMKPSSDPEQEESI